MILLDVRQCALYMYMLAYVGLVFINSVESISTIDDAYVLHSDLFSNYNKNVRPIYNQDSAIYVSAVMYIKSIQEFDEVNEKYSFAAALIVSWTDDKLKWNVSAYNGLSQTTVSYDDIWVPELILGTPSNKVTSIGRSSDRMRIEHTGSVQWMPAALIQSTCSVNVKNYPFDTQTCETKFVSLGYKNTEVVLIALSSKIYLDVYSPNALWEITDSNVATISLGTGGESEMVFTVYLKRKSALVVINIIMPILLLSIVNIFVFLLVPESGERIGYCITTLLAIAVYMTIVSDMLPQNSEPVPLISYKLFVDLLISVLIVLCTILNLRLYHRDDDRNVPIWLKSMYRVLTCYACKLRKVQPIASIKQEKGQQKEVKVNDYNVDVKEVSTREADDLPTTWKNISYMFDWIALFTFTALTLINSVVYVVIARHSAA